MMPNVKSGLHLIYILMLAAFIDQTLSSLALKSCDVTNNKLVVNPGADVMIGGLVPVREPISGGYRCGDMTGRMDYIEVLKWTVNRLNQDSGSIHGQPITESYVPGISLGLELYDYCGSPDIAIHGLHEIVPQLADSAYDCEAMISTIFLGLITSSSGPEVAQGIAEASTKSGFPQLEIRAGLSSLSENRESNTVLSMSSSKENIVKVMVILAIELKWRHANVVYSDDAQGNDLQNIMLKHVSDTTDLCIATAVGIDLAKSDDISLQSLLLKLSKSGASGVIYLGGETVLRKLFEFAEGKPYAGLLQWITPYEITGKYARGAISITHGVRRIEEFESHWLRINDVSTTSNNTWFDEWYMTTNKCRLPGVLESLFAQLPDCVTQTEAELREALSRENVESAILAVYVYAKALKNAHSSLCGDSARGLCNSLAMLPNDRFLRDYLRPLDFRFGEEERMNSLAFAPHNNWPHGGSRRVSFDTHGVLEDAVYRVSNYQNTSTEFEYHAVGLYLYNEFLLRKNELIHYETTRDVPLPTLVQSDCPLTGCGQCFTTHQDPGVTFMYREGDLLLGASFQVHLPGSGCGDLDIYSGPRLVEAFNFALDDVNAKNILNGLKLGAFAFDNCAEEDIAVSTMSTLYSGVSKFQNGRGGVIDPDKIPIFLGGRHNVDEYKVLEKYYIPLIGFRSFDHALNDRVVSPLYLSTTLSTTDLINMYSLTLQEFGHKYIQVLIQPDSRAEAALGKFKDKLAKDGNICIHTISIAMETREYRRILSKMAAESEASALVVIGDYLFVLRLFEALTLEGLENRFNIIGFLGFVVQEDIFVENQAASNYSIAFTLYPGNSTVVQFERYLNDIDPVNATNPWFQDWYEIMHNCTFKEQSLLYNTKCTGNELLVNSHHYYVDPFVRNTMNAVYTAAYGLRQVLTQYCGTNFTSVCAEFYMAENRGSQLLEAMLNLEFDGAGGERVFYHNNRAVEKLGIWQIVNGKFVELGNYTTESRNESANIYIDNSRLKRKEKIYNSSLCTGACQQCLYTEIPGQMIVMDGDIMLGGIFDIHDTGKNPYSCGDIKTSDSILTYAAFEYAIQQINSQQAPLYVPMLRNLSLGYISIDTCSSPVRTSTFVSGIESELIDSIEIKNSKTAGWIYGSTSLLGIFDQFSAANRIPLVGGLMSGAGSENFFNTLPSDRSHVEAMVLFLEEIDWKYVNIIIDNDERNTEMFYFLKQELRHKGICAVGVYNSSNLDKNEIVSSLIQSPTSVTIILVNRIDNIHQARVNVGIPAEDLTFVYFGNVSFSGYFDISIYYHMQTSAHVADYLLEVYQDPNSHPWTREYLQQKYQCNIGDARKYAKSCSDIMSEEMIEQKRNDIMSNPVFSATVNAVFALATAVNNVLVQICGTPNNGLCSEFHRIDNLKEDIIAALHNVQFMTESNEDFSFSASHQEYDPGLVISYNNGDRMEQFGRYQGGKLIFTQNKGAFPSNVLMSCGTQCAQCTDTSHRNDGYTFLPGDLILAGVFDVHNAGNDPFSCGALNLQSGYPLLEAFNYAVQYINQRQGIFRDTLRGVTLGSLTLDSCKSPTRVTSVISNIHAQQTPITNGNNRLDPSRISAYIGGFSSATSQAMTSLLNVLNVPQISYGATSVELKRGEFALFLRTVPADDKQARAMVALLKRVGFEYVQVLHSSGPTGEGGASEFIQLAQERRICIAQTIKLPHDFIASDADAAVLELMQKRNASVVLLFLDYDGVIPVLEAINRNAEARNAFLLIGSETWADRDDVMKAVPSVAKNSITLGVENADVPRFDEYLNSITSTAIEDNESFRKYYEHIYQCSIDGTESIYPECTAIRGLASASEYKQDPYVLHVVNAVFAAVLGIHDTLQQVCGNNYEGICSRYFSAEAGPKQLYNAIKAVRFQDETRKTFEFTAEGESSRGYNLYAVNEVFADDLYLSDIGSYNDAPGLTLDSTLQLADQWTSNCQNAGACTECAQQMTSQTRHVMTNPGASLHIMAYLDIHQSDPSDALKCGDLDIEHGWLQMLAFFYALESLPVGNEEIGGVVVDTCGNDVKATQDLVSHLTLSGFSGGSQSEGTNGVHPENVLAYMSSGNENTGAATRIVSSRGAVVMTPDAGGLSLTYTPRFIRLAPSDGVVARVKAEIARSLNFTYVAIMTSSDADNMQAAEMFLNSAQGHSGSISVCVANKIVIQSNSTTQDVILLVESVLQSHDVNVVITFLTDKDTNHLIKAMRTLINNGQNEVRRMNFIGLQTSTDNHRYLRGSLFIQPQGDFPAEFITYLETLTPTNHGKIPDLWFEEFWQRTFEGKLVNAAVVATQYTRECTQSMRIGIDDVTMNPYVLRIIAATQAVVIAMHVIEACHSRDNKPECFKNLPNRNKHLLQALEDTEWASGQYRFSFSDVTRADPQRMDIMNLQRDGSHYKYVKVGQWYPDSGLELDTSRYVTYNLAGQPATDFSSTCPSGDTCSCIANTGINGGPTGGYVPNNQPSTQKLKHLDNYDNYNEIWGIILAVLSGLGVIISILLFVYLMIYYPVKGGTSVLGYLLLFGALCLYLLNFAFLWLPTYEICIIRRLGFGVIYAFIFSCFLVKVLNTWRLGDEWEMSPKYERLSHPCSLVAIAIGLTLVQVVIATEWLVLQEPNIDHIEYKGMNYPRCQPTDFYNEEMALSCIYVMFLILLTAIFAAVTWKSHENHRESRWILITSIFTAIIWIAWILMTLLADYKYRDPAMIIANLINATVLLMCMFIRKIYLLNKYTREIAEDDKKSHVSTLSRRSPSSNGYHMNPAYVVADSGSMHSSSKHSAGAPYVIRGYTQATQSTS